MEDFAGEVALEAAHDLVFGLAFGEAPRHVAWLRRWRGFGPIRPLTHFSPRCSRGCRPDAAAPTVQAVADWLAEQRVGQVTLVTPQPLLVDIEAAKLLVDLDTHPLVREAIDNSPLREGPAPVHLDAGLIRLGGDVGRPITQAVSRAQYERHPEVDGIAYWSRIDSSERCWAIYGHVPVDVSITDLSAENPLHSRAVQEAAHLLKIPALLTLPWAGC